MPEKIEVYPFLQWDIRDLITLTPVTQGQINQSDANDTTRLIMDKVTVFINENYTLKS